MGKNDKRNPFVRKRLRQTGQVMKLLSFIFLTTILQVSAHVYSQNEKVTLHLQDASLEEVFKNLEAKSGYMFLYQSHLIRTVRHLNPRYQNVPLGDILDDCLKGTDLAWQLVDKTIVVTARKQMTEEIAKIRVTGSVKDKKGEVLPAVTIRIKGTGVGFTTDTQGHFDIDVPQKEGLTLIFSYVGFKRKEIPVDTINHLSLNITLEEDLQEIGEVVVTGIFNKPKESFTGSVQVITREELKNNYSRSMLQTISNLEPSFRIIENNAAGSNPNVMPEIQLRGAASLPDVSDVQFSTRAELNTPLFILDGFEISLERVMDLNEEEVESITILKDAGATALYGSRGANGVIVITSSVPKEGKLQVRYSGTVRIEKPDLSSYNMCDALEKLEIEKEAGIYSTEALRQQYEELLAQAQGGTNTDWMSLPLRTGVGHRHSLSIQGGIPSFRYALSLNYDVNKGVMKGSERKVFNGTLNLAYEQRSWRVNNTVTIGLNNAADSPFGQFGDYARMNPYWKLLDANGKAVKQYSHPLNSNLLANPYYNGTLNTWSKQKYTNITNNFRVQVTPWKTVQVGAGFSMSSNISNNDSFKPASHTDFLSVGEVEKRGRYSMSDRTQKKWQVNGDIRYGETLGKHSIYTGITYELSEQTSDRRTIQATGFINDAMDHISNALNYDKTGRPQGEEATARRVGVVATFNYNFASRYFFDVNYRVDGSSSFGKDSRFATFYSAGAGYQVSNERFWERIKPFMSNLKVKYSYGVSGTLGFSPYQAMAVYQYDQLTTYHGENGAMLMRFPNPDLKWQNTFQHNMGIETGFFNNRLTVNYTYYTKRTNNVLTDMGLSASHGYEYFKDNIGVIRNEGHELQVSCYVIRNVEKDLSLNVNGRFARNINTIVTLSEGLKKRQKLLTGSSLGSNTVMQYKEGESMDAIYCLRSLGIEPATGQRLYLDADGNATTLKDVMAQVACGNTQPKINGSLSLMLSWKGLMVNVGFQLRWGGQVMNSTLLDKVENANLTFNVDRRVFTDRWRKPGDRALYKALDSEVYTYINDCFVQDDRTLECTNINLGYDFPRKWIQRHLGVQSLNIGMNLSDIFYISTIKRERGTAYPYSRNPNFMISCTF